MSKTKRVAEQLKRRLPDCFMRTDIIVHSKQYKYIIHGLTLERTAYKDTYYARMQVLPFFRASDTVALTYSDRIGNSTPGSPPETFVGSFDDVADQLWHSMRHFGLIERLRQPYTFEDFISQFDYADYETRGIDYEVFDIACAAAMVGEVARPERFLLRLKHTHEQNVLHAPSTVPAYEVRLYHQVTACLDALARGPGHLREHIIAAITRNARHLGFEPVGPVQP